MAKFTIVEILDWQQDDHEIAGDSCHMAMSDVYFQLANELKEKAEEGNWPGLPFTCEAEDEDEALEKYREEHCSGAYVIPTSADIEEEEEDDEDDEDGEDGDDGDGEED